MDGQLVFDSSALSELLRDVPKGMDFHLVADSKAWEHHQALVMEIFEGVPIRSQTLVEATPELKTMTAVDQLAVEALDKGVSKKSILLVVGGGTVLDMATFMASNLYRGLGTVLLPSTLLAQVDAGIGGKGGLDVGGKRNIFSTIHFPMATFVEPHFLESLSERDIKSGYGEMLKHALLMEDPHFDEIETLIQSGCPHPSVELVQRHASFKNRVVEADPFEFNDQRIFLNLGHSFAHALEATMSIPHGHAVAWGCAVAVMASVKTYNFPMNLARRIVHVSRLLTSSYSIDPNVIAQELTGLICFDKKQTPNGLRSVLLKNIGEPGLHTNLSAEVIRESIFEVSFS